MARRGSSSAGHYVQNTPGFGSTPFTEYTYLVATRANHVPATSSIEAVFNVGIVGDSWFGIEWNHTTASFSGAAFHRDAAPQFTPVTFGALSADTWYVLGTRWAGVLTIDSYKDGEYVTSATISQANLRNIGSVSVAALSTVYNSSQFFSGDVAWVAVWDDALSNEEISRASIDGPSVVVMIRPSRLRLFWVLNGLSPERDLSGNGLNGTVTGTTIIEPIYRSVRRVRSRLDGPSVHTMTSKVLF